MVEFYNKTVSIARHTFIFSINSKAGPVLRAKLCIPTLFDTCMAINRKRPLNHHRAHTVISAAALFLVGLIGQNIEVVGKAALCEKGLALT